MSWIRSAGNRKGRGVFPLLSIVCLVFGNALASEMKSVPKRKGVLLHSISPARIELPRGGTFELGEDVFAHLAGELTRSGQFRVIDERRIAEAVGFSTAKGLPLVSKRLTRTRSSDAPTSVQTVDWVWNGSQPESMRAKVQIQSFIYQIGERGERTTYGFDSHSPWVPNDFPLKSDRESRLQGASHFGRAFEPVSESLWQTTAGLDLGQGVGVNILAAYLRLKLVRFVLKSHVTLELENVSDHQQVAMPWVFASKGFQFDIMGGYLGYSGGLGLAREDVLRRSGQALAQDVLPAIQAFAEQVPLRAVVDAVIQPPAQEPVILLGTGIDSQIQSGVRFGSTAPHSNTVIEVIRSVESGSIGRLVSGALRDLHVGMVLVEKPNTLGSPESSLSSIQSRLARHSADGPESEEQMIKSGRDLGTLAAHPVLVAEHWADSQLGQAILNSIKDSVLLPYRLFRFAKTDQKLHKKPDSVGFSRVQKSVSAWRKEIIEAASAKTLGWQALLHTDGDSIAAGQGVTVALLDTGIDYNHPVLHERVLRREDAHLDEFGRGNRYGWDFVSGDSQPYDEHGRGTAIASLIAAIAPGARILPLKVFNPWGVTSTQNLVSGIRMALNAGAQVIVLGWSSEVGSVPLRLAIEEASAQGALLITISGDEGGDLARTPRYPAVWSDQIPGLLTVAALDSAGKWLYQKAPIFSGYSSKYVQLGVPAEDIPVLKPRTRKDRWSGPALAAAGAAGAAARLPVGWSGEARKNWLLQNAAAGTDPLSRVIQGGRVLDLSALGDDFK